MEEKNELPPAALKNWDERGNKKAGIRMRIPAVLRTH
jgi:hypothetical protein